MATITFWLFVALLLLMQLVSEIYRDSSSQAVSWLSGECFQRALHYSILRDECRWKGKNKLKFQGLDEQDPAGWNNAVTDANPFSVVCWDASHKLAPLPCDVHPGSDTTYVLRCTRQQQIFDGERELRRQLRSVCIRRTEILAHGEGCIPAICTHNDVTAWDAQAQVTSGVA